MDLKKFGIMLDCSRNGVMTIKALKKWVDILSDLGFNCLLLYTEDTYEIEEEPMFGYLRGRYTKAELRELDDYAFSKGIEVIPCIQTLAHLNCLFHWSEYTPIRDCDDILLAENERTYELIEKMFHSLSECYRSRNINIGMDEAHLLGRGKYADINGNRDRSEILLRHLCKVSEIAEKYGFRLTMWSDMFIRLLTGGNYYPENLEIPEEIKNKVPDNVDIVYWDYYSQEREHYSRQMKMHEGIKSGYWFAGGLWNWTGFAAHNEFSIKATKAALDACCENNVENVFLTTWGDDGADCSRYAILPSLYFASEYKKGNTDMESLKKGFEQKFGIPFDTFMLTDLLGTAGAKEDSFNNPEKYLLYNDLFLGFFDTSISGEEGAEYKRCAEKLKTAESFSEFGHIFKTYRRLCEVLEIKASLGIKSREAYQKGEKAALSKLIPIYDELILRLEAFYDAFENQWMKENKPQGFEVQNIRIGGLINRAKYCRKSIAGFVSGEREEIPELKESLVKFQGADAPAYFCYNSWRDIVTPGTISMNRE